MREKGEKKKNDDLGGRAERDGGRGGPWEADAGERKGRARKQAGGRGRCQGRSGWQTPSSQRRTTVIRGWVIIRLLTAGFPLQHKQTIIPHCQQPPVGVRCPQMRGKRLERLHDRESL